MNSILVLFDDLGISKKMLVPVLTSSPQLLLRKPNEFLQVCIFICFAFRINSIGSGKASLPSFSSFSSSFGKQKSIVSKYLVCQYCTCYIKLTSIIGFIIMF